jgi:hypothetical protein
MSRLAERGGIRVIIDRHRSLNQVRDPIAQREIFPSVDLVRFANLSRPRIDRAAEPDADGAELLIRSPTQFADGLADLFADSTTAKILAHRPAPSAGDNAGAFAGDKLQFGAADFDSQKNRRMLTKMPAAVPFSRLFAFHIFQFPQASLNSRRLLLSFGDGVQIIPIDAFRSCIPHPRRVR